MEYDQEIAFRLTQLATGFGRGPLNQDSIPRIRQAAKYQRWLALDRAEKNAITRAERGVIAAMSR